mgnify:CR=1 FL=1
MKILLTGGAGFIGSHTLIELTEAGHEAVVVDNLDNSSPISLKRVAKIIGKEVPFYKVDIRDREGLQKVFDEHKFDACIHFAGLKAVGESCAKPLEYYENNMNGTFVLADVMRKVNFTNEVTFIQVSSYQGTESTGNVKQKLGIDFDITDRDIILVEDIVETGHSIEHMIEYLQNFNPNSIEVCTLFYKPEKHLYNREIKYVAMEIGNEFIAGYGLDYDQIGRGLKDIYVVTND